MYTDRAAAHGRRKRDERVNHPEDDRNSCSSDSCRAIAWLREGCDGASDDDDSLGTRTLPTATAGLDDDHAQSSAIPQSDADDRRQNLRIGSVATATAAKCRWRAVASDEEMLPVAYSDVSFLDNKAHPFQYTLAIVKPDAARLMYKVETLLARNEFIIKTKTVLRLSREQAADFYERHSLEPYFPRLVQHMSGGPIVVYVLAKRDCVRDWRRLIGPADVRVAQKYFPLSLRAVYGTAAASATSPPSVANAFHGSESPEVARREIRFFFPGSQAAAGPAMTATPDGYDVARYVREFLVPEIAEGLSETVENNPRDPLRWFGNWLLHNKVLA